jgi:hypothetical protein
MFHLIIFELNELNKSNIESVLRFEKKGGSFVQMSEYFPPRKWFVFNLKPLFSTISFFNIIASIHNNVLLLISIGTFIVISKIRERINFEF